MADPVNVQCSTSCTATINFSTDILNIDSAGGIALSGAIVGVWALGWAFRVLVRAVRDSEAATSTE